LIFYKSDFTFASLAAQQHIRGGGSRFSDEREGVNKVMESVNDERLSEHLREISPAYIKRASIGISTSSALSGTSPINNPRKQISSPQTM